MRSFLKEKTDLWRTLIKRCQEIAHTLTQIILAFWSQITHISISALIQITQELYSTHTEFRCASPGSPITQHEVNLLFIPFFYKSPIHPSTLHPAHPSIHLAIIQTSDPPSATHQYTEPCWQENTAAYTAAREFTWKVNE